MSIISKLVARIRGYHSVDAAIAGVHKAVANLNAVEEFHALEAKAQAEMEKLAAEARAFAEAERDKAKRIADRIKALVA